MVKIFTKLNLADIVATSGGKSFRKLSTEKPLTDLRGTTWEVLKYWKATAGYGTYSINGAVTYQGNVANYPFEKLKIGGKYYDSGASGTQADIIGVADERKNHIEIATSKSFTITFVGGADVTNADLIAWLKQYGTQIDVPLISFTIDGTTYQAESGWGWGVWCNSKYNTDGYVRSGLNIMKGSAYLKTSSGAGVQYSQTINENGVYTLLI